jgi:pteridine reductase
VTLPTAIVSLLATSLNVEPHAGATPQQVREVSGHAFQVLMWLSLLVVVLLCLALWIALRRVRALQSMERRPGTTSTPALSAWEEAGRRVTPMRVDDLERQAATGQATPPGDAVQATPARDPGAIGGARPLALVTGASRRVGRAIALELARAGCDLLITYRSSEQEADSLSREVAAMGGQATLYRVDLSDLGEVERFGDQLAQSLPKLDVLVHNAAAYEPTPIASDGSGLDVNSLREQMTINAMAPLVLTAQLRGLLERSRLPGGASVVAIGDIHAMGRPRATYVAYAMSKAAVLEMVHCLARELAPQVRVNAIAPGVIAWQEREDPGTSMQVEQAKYLRRIPLGRFGTPDDAAKVVRWLALDATYITGQILRVDGGRWLT